MSDLAILANLPRAQQPKLVNVLAPTARPVVLEIGLVLLAEDADGRTFNSRFVAELRRRVEDGEDDLAGVLQVVTDRPDDVADLREKILELRRQAEVYAAILRLLPTLPAAANGRR